MAQPPAVDWMSTHHAIARKGVPTGKESQMSRIATMLDRPRRTLAALATVLAAAGLTVASGADFTATAANPANTFTTGTLAVANSHGNAAILNASDLRPGDPPVSGTVDIENSGSLSAEFTLTRGTPADSDAGNPLSDKLDLVVRDCGAFTQGGAPACGPADGVLVYSGTLAGMDDAEALGEFDGGEQHRFRFDVALDASAGNVYQGATSSAAFTWDAA